VETKELQMEEQKGQWQVWRANNGAVAYNSTGLSEDPIQVIARAAEELAKEVLLENVEISNIQVY
jgi:hypothetical protein